MIRQITKKDIGRVLDIWLKSTIKAHPFISKEYWHGSIESVKNEYLPNSDTYVYEEKGKIYGFISVNGGGFIGAVYVDTEKQSKGIGTKLINFMKEKYNDLTLAVYEKNAKAVNFYQKSGFRIFKEQIDKKTNMFELIMEWKSKKKK